MLTIKNKNLYYYNYLITNKQLSLFLVPLGLLIILNKNYIKYFSYIFFLYCSYWNNRHYL